MVEGKSKTGCESAPWPQAALALKNCIGSPEKPPLGMIASRRGCVESVTEKNVLLRFAKGPASAFYVITPFSRMSSCFTVCTRFCLPGQPSRLRAVPSHRRGNATIGSTCLPAAI